MKPNPNLIARLSYYKIPAPNLLGWQINNHGIAKIYPAFQRIWTAVGAPCLGFPAAWREDGLPLGLQIIAKPGADRQLLSDAATILAHAALKED